MLTTRSQVANIVTEAMAAMIAADEKRSHRSKSLHEIYDRNRHCQGHAQSSLLDQSDHSGNVIRFKRAKAAEAFLIEAASSPCRRCLWRDR